jgi:hypothetical protein
MSSVKEDDLGNVTGQYHDIKIANSCFENVAQFRYLGTTITKPDSGENQEEIELR